MEMHPGGSAELLWRASAVNSALGDGVDYDTPAGTLTFPPGVTTQNIPLTIRDDALRESGERIVIRLKNASGAALGTPAAFTFSIGDNDGMPNIEQWRVAHFGANAGGNPDAADLADPDGDGLANLLEYALGLDPLAAGSSGVTTDFEAIGAAQYLRMTVSKNPSATDVTFRIESSDSPAAANWSASGTTIELDNATTLRARDNTPSGAAPQRYLHLKITRNLVP